MKDNFKIPKGTRESRIKQNVAHRQALKKKWDRHCKYEAVEGEMLHSGYSAIEHYDADQNDNYVRLLDEGVVVDGGGWAYAVIAKGTLKAWYDNLSTKFVGKINKDHCDAIDLGTFKKKDLKLVELGNDRYGIDVNVKLDDELYAVKDLKHMMNRKALSSEFYWDAEQYVTAEAATGDEKQGKWLIPVINEISIDAYAVVDNPKNANSFSDTLLEKASNESSEGDEMTEEELKAKAAAEAAEAEKNAADADADAATDNQAEGDGEGEGEGTDNTEGEADKTNANAEETDGDTEDEGAEDTEGEGEKTEEGEDKKSELSIEKLTEAFKSLKADNAAKDEEIAKLKAELASKQEKEDKYMSDLADLFKFATTDEPAEGEGADNKTPEEDTKDSYEAALEAAFKEMEG